MEAFGSKDKVVVQSAVKSCTSIITSNKTNTNCKFCNKGTHPLFACKEFLALEISDRLKFVQNHKLCMNCMKTGHISSQCASRNCTKCEKRHNTLLHLPTKSSLQKKNAEEETASTLTTAVLNRAYVVLGTVKIKLSSGYGSLLECRAVLDSGSQINLITENLAKKLKLQVNIAPISIEGIGQRKKGCKGYADVQIRSLASSFNTNIEVFVIPKIVSPQPVQEIDISSWNIPPNITLADPEFNKPAEIDLLIGAELYHNLLKEGRLHLSEDLPTLQNTVFGWMCCGKVNDMSRSTLTCGISVEDDESLNSILTKFWELDSVQQTNQRLTVAENRCEELFHQTTTRNEEGRFIVRLPFNTDTSSLGETLQMTTNRFYSLEQRLLRQPKIKEMYIEFMREYERLGHMIKLNCSRPTKPYYAIPHHCVLKPDSSTTKLRVVFDASAKTSSGVSLNDIMYKGPVIQSDLTSILLRFRKHRFVFTTDIEKMYRQIFVHPDDQRLQVIVWREHPNDQLQLYQLTTVTYGTRAAPYLSTKCLQHLAHDNKKSLPLGSAALDKDFYVDDGLSGSDSLREALLIKNQLIEILSSGGFKLRKWCANTPQLLEGIPLQDQEVDLNFQNDGCRESIKTLGLTWLPKTDELCIKTNHEFKTPITKRTVISEVARVYDPLGLVAPVIVKAKIFIQHLWQSQLDWDDIISETHKEEWLKFRQELHTLNDVRITRHIVNHKQPNNIQLHVFTDASEKAYGAAVYVRSENKDGTISVQLLCSKSRVAPLKMQTIPRLELCAAVLGSELLTKVQQDLNYQHVVTYCWTDSEIVLHWINSEPAIFQTFVAHRIAKIQELTSHEQWRHVGTKHNPADLVSRGIYPCEIKQNTLWWYGPFFLQGKETCWPAKFNKTLIESDNTERKICQVGLAAATPEDLVKFIYTINHRGKFLFLQRTVAYVLRFIANMSKSTNDIQTSISTLSATELDNAMFIIIKAIQKSEFEDELKQLLKSNKTVNTSPLANLSPFLDSNNIIRVGGRLQNSNLPFDARHPMLLPYNDPIVKLMMHQLHENNLHCGPQALLAQMRQRFWPIKGKLMARSIVQHCVRCTRSQPKLFNQIMGNLPQDRVHLERPFLNTGVDFCGPIWIHYKIRGKRPCKAYIAIFCCFATKAVHLELVGDLTTDAFLGALNRFTFRRGRCQRIYCDNATNFVGAKNQLAELDICIHNTQSKDKIINFCAQKGIDFQFIPPRAPHFGGLWEAALKSAKHLLVRGIGNVSLTYEEMDTVIVQIEGILNSRPIVPMSSNPNDLTALTPGHFLIGEPITSHPCPTSKGVKPSLLQRWKLVQHIKEEFWARWTKEYLSELQCRTKWKSQSTNVEPGTMVIIKEDNIPPLHWPLGRIVKTFNGPDNCVRVAEIKTSTGIVKRAIHRLAPLFPDNNPASHNKTIDSEENNLTTPQKRPRLNTTLMAIIALIFCLPLVLANTVEVIKFPNKPGIHFEYIGKSKIITSHWTLLIYYDLAPLKNEMEALANGTWVLDQMCQRIPCQSCSDLVIQFTHAQRELESDGKFLLQRRKKRGAINVVGNVANALFGVLDSEYATKMTQTIQNLDNDQNHIVELVKNQTSIIDSTINIIKTDQETVKRKFDALDKSLNEIKKTTAKDEELLQSMLSVSLQLIMITSNLHRTQTIILNVLTDVHHGHIGPLILSPDQLKAEIIKIKAHLPSSMQLPAQNDDIFALYKLMKVQAGLTNQHILFKIKLPLLDIHDFNVYNVIPIPTLINGSLYVLKSTTDILAITAHGDQYYPLTQLQYNDCFELGQQTRLCEHTQIIYNRGSTANSCEVNLFNNKTRLSCEVIRSPHSHWTRMKNKNQWIFSLKESVKVTGVCENNIRQISLEGAGMLKIGSGCTLKNELFTLIGHQTLNSTSTINSSLTSHGLWKYLENPKTAEPVLLEKIVEPYNTEINEIIALQKLIKEQHIDRLHSKDQITTQHVLGVGYTALTLGAVIGLYLIVRSRIPQRTKPRENEDAPSPAPRHDFSIHV